MKRGEGRPVVLADRDGTLIHDIPYLSRLEDITLLPGVGAAIRELNRREIPVALVTNQSGVARGYFSESFILESHARLMELLAKEGASLQGLYYCPHLEIPDEGFASSSSILGEYLRRCSCRKPEPGMILRALADLGGDPEKSAVIGDADRDIEAGERAGLRMGYRVVGAEGAGTRSEKGIPVRSFAEGVERFLSDLESMRSFVKI